MDLVSIVVCVYNVERYIWPCLDSIRHQSYPNIEVIVVDDQSNDNTSSIASRFCAADSRFHYLRQPNRGPGPAGGRNGGIPYATGEWILFVDSDDIIDVDMVRLMVQSAQRSGSEVVVAGVGRMNDDHQKWDSFLHHRAHQEAVSAGQLCELDQLVWDSTAWNKLVKMDLWRKTVNLFDEPHLYEDLYPMTKVMSEANSVDVLTDVLYWWRARSDGSSVTQMAGDLLSLNDKIDQVTKLRNYLKESQNFQILTYLDRKLAEGDLHWILDQIGTATPQYCELVLELVPDIVADLHGDAYNYLPARDRCGLNIAQALGTSEFVDLMAAFPTHWVDYMPLVHIDGVLHLDQAQLARKAGVDFDGEPIPLGPGDTATTRASITSAEISDGQLILSGQACFAAIAFQDSDQPWVRVGLRREPAGAELSASAELGSRRALHLNRSGFTSHRHTAWEATFDLSEVKTALKNCDRLTAWVQLYGSNAMSGTAPVIIKPGRSASSVAGLRVDIATNHFTLHLDAGGQDSGQLLESYVGKPLAKRAVATFNRIFSA